MKLPPSDFDTPWKDILEIYFHEFMDFFFPHISQEINWNKPPEFLNTELKKLMAGNIAHNKWVDKLVKVSLKNGASLCLIIHIEIQSQFDGQFLLRMYTYNYRAFDHYQQPVLSLAILCDDDPRWRPQHFSQKIFGCETSFTFPIVKLIDFENRIEELKQTMNPFGIISLAHLTAIKQKNI